MAAVTQVNHFDEIRIEGPGQLTINQIVTISVAEVKTRAFVPSSPYLGLRRFEERNKEFFFGRDRLVEQLLQLMSQRNLVLVAGPSGSGKSSVVRAGLLPLLAARFAQGRFRALVMTPDRDPFSSLRAAMQVTGSAQSQLHALDSHTADSITSVLTTQRPADERWLLLIDQFANRHPHGARFRRFRHPHGATLSPGSWGQNRRGGARFRQGHGATASPGSWGQVKAAA